MMGAIAAPILPGKEQTWEKWIADCKGPRKAEFDDMNQRFGLTSHRVWLQQTPDGHELVIAVHEGPGAEEYLGKLAASENDFDVWFRGVITDVHGIDFSKPLPPAAVQKL
jgi:hypothetical protein